MKSEKIRLILLASISAVSCLIVGVLIIFLSYRSDLENTFVRLQDTVSSQARLIEAIARYEAGLNLETDPVDRTLEQILDAYSTFSGFGETGEFALARLVDGKIVFLHQQRIGTPTVPTAIALDAEWAEPMRRALRGEAGTIIAEDYRGEMVLAAFEPVDLVNFGLVAKIDRDEILRGHLPLAATAVMIAVLVSILSTIVFLRMSEPIIGRLRNQKSELEASVSQHQQTAIRLGYREEQQRAIALLGVRALQGVSLDDLFAQALSAVAEVLGLKFASVLELQADKQNLLLRAGIGWRSGRVGQATIPVDGDSQVAFTLRTRAAVSASDLTHESRFSPSPLMAEHQIESAVSSLIGSPEQPWGVFAVHGEEVSNFNEMDVYFVQSLANLLTSAISRLRADEDLRQWEALFLHSAWGIAISNAAGDALTAVNPAFAKMHGYTVKEALAVAPADYHETAVVPMAEEGTTSRTSESNRVRKDGSVFPALQNVTIIYDERGVIKRRVANVQDNSARIELEEKRLEIERQIQDAQKFESLGVLAGGIAHDFNNILMTILGNADLALLDLSPQAPARPSIESIETAARQAAGLARQMLAYSGKGQFVVEHLSINSLVEEIAHLFEVSVSKNVVLKYNFGDNLPPIKADSSQVSQILMNLIVNASEAIGGKSGVIQLTTGVMDCDREYLDSVAMESRVGIDAELAEGMYIYVQVSDTGCGMDKQTLARIFEPFFSTKRTGRGLGMAAMLGIIRAHRGAVKVYSEVGRGSSFKVLLPVSADYEDDWNREKVQEGTRTGMLPVGGTILLADDDESILALGKRALQRLGFESILANDGEEAVAAFRKHSSRIDCIILDLTMPKLSGVDAFREIRRIQPDAKVILCSGYDEEQVTQEFAGKRLNGFLHKPYTFRELKLKLLEVLG